MAGSFALAAGALTTARAARHDRHRVERGDPVRVAAEMIRGSDAMWVPELDYCERWSHWAMPNVRSEETLQAFRERTAGALRTYTNANDTSRSLAAEMRQPGIAAEAGALARPGAEPRRRRGGGPVASMNPPGEERRNAEAAFMDTVRARMDELA